MPFRVLAASTTQANAPIAPEQDCTLTLRYLYDGTAFAGVCANAYRVADVSADFQYTLTAPFRDSGLDLNGIQTQAEWDVIRSTLESYILANRIQPAYTDRSDEAGMVRFSSLQPGLYLVAEADGQQGDQLCSFCSALIALPGLGEDGIWQYRVTANPKPTPLPPIGPDDFPEYRVLKLWKGNDPNRPESIEVEIFLDGESYEIVTLSEENHWTYSWRTDRADARWAVAERNIPAGYTVTLEERTTTFILTNTLPSEKPDAPPKTGDTPHILLYTVLMFVSGSAFVLLWVTGKRKPHET